MLVDANVLLYAVDSTAAHHVKAKTWLDGALTGSQRIGLPWQTIGAFLRIVTHPRIFQQPLDPGDAWGIVDHWLSAPQVWVPAAGERTARILGDLLVRRSVAANLVPDAQVAALALEHGVPVVSADSDFARFPEVRWINPCA